MRIDNNIQCASSQLLSGRCETSPTFIARTSFASESEFRDIVEATFQSGMTWENYGTGWQLDHKIPREAYDFDNPDDIKRCWSRNNVHALTKAANLEKSWKFVDQYIFEAGVECLPVSWNGKFPDNDFKIAHGAKMLAHKMTEEAKMEDEEEQPPPQEVGSSSTRMIDAPDSDSE